MVACCSPGHRRQPLCTKSSVIDGSRSNDYPDIPDFRYKGRDGVFGILPPSLLRYVGAVKAFHARGAKSVLYLVRSSTSSRYQDRCERAIEEARLLGMETFDGIVVRSEMTAAEVADLITFVRSKAPDLVIADLCLRLSAVQTRVSIDPRFHIWRFPRPYKPT